jgi:sirohydrochlorin cobaltochelatase
MDEAVFFRLSTEMRKEMDMCGNRIVGLAVVLSALFMCAAAPAYERPERKPAIVLAAFGTTDEEAVHSILNIKDRVETAFPEYDVSLAFTSNLIRSIWHERAGDGEYRKDNPEIPEEVYAVGSVLTALALAQEDGGRLVLVQSLHVTDGEEFTNLQNLVKMLFEYPISKRVRHPFPWIGVGEPALGIGDGQPKYLERAAAAIAPLARGARDSGAALVLMGHGNEHLEQNVFAKFEQVLRKRYGPHVYIGSVEAPPFAEEIVEAMAKAGDVPKKILLAPFMVVAGDHARNDMAGGEGDSWASVFRENGYEVETFLRGLGSNDNWADIYVEHLKALEPRVKAMRDAEPGEEGH